MLIVSLFTLASCGSDSHMFRVEGKLRGIDQAEFFVYSPDGLLSRLDTIHVKSGRFTYDVSCEAPGTLVIVFPNYSEQPVFAEPGKSVSLSGNVSNLRELTVKGTSENKTMNLFREHVASASPQEMKQTAEMFIKDHPDGLMAVFLLGKYFIQCETPDYKKASALLTIIRKAQPKNGRLAQIESTIRALGKTSVGTALPRFTATDKDGKNVNSSDYMKGTAFIYAWSTFDFESTNVQRTVNSVTTNKNQPGKDPSKESDIKKTNVKVLGVNIDIQKDEARKTLERDHIECTTVFDGNLFDGPLAQSLGFATIPDNILIKDGKIIARGLNSQQIREKLK